MNRNESPEIESYAYGQQIYNRARKVSAINGAVENGQSHAEKSI